MLSDSPEPGRTTSAETSVVTVGLAETSVVSAVSAHLPVKAVLPGVAGIDSRKV